LQTFYSEQDVHQVTVPGADGDFGILANHVPTLTVLRPGVVTVMESASGAAKTYFGT
jgi:F0F1-type ATP synthase epsilon subunit